MTGMQISFIGHSCFVLKHAGTGVLCDPWFSGRVFQEGWAQYSPVTASFDDLPAVNYLWISHEHPDHFHPPTLRSITPKRRSTMTALYQATTDKRVVEFLHDLGFGQVWELEPRWTALEPDLEILCVPHEEGNSWVAFRTKTETILNLNDCGLRTRNELARVNKAVGDLDLLLTQFSYANWFGNPNQPELRRHDASEKLEMVALQCRTLRAKQVIPFASQMYFCHQENFYLNDSANLPADAVSFLSEHSKSEPVVLYNGDSFEPGGPHSTTSACERYERDWTRAINAGPIAEIRTESVTMTRLEEETQAFLNRLEQDAPWYLRRMLGTARIFLWDHGHSVHLTLAGIARGDTREEQCDIALHSESLMLCLQRRYGLDTLGVSGRMHKPAGGSYRRYYRFFRPGMIVMRGTHVGMRYIMSSIINKAMAKFGLRSY